MKKYFHIPQRCEVYEVTPNCCYNKVIYDGPILGMVGKNDEECDSWNSWDLECFSCHPGLEIIPVAKDFYQVKYLEMMKKNSAAA